MLTTSDLITIGKYMRASANDREGLPLAVTPMVPVQESWGFVCDNAGEDSVDLFGVNVPESGLPELAPHAFIVAYYANPDTEALTLELGIAACMSGNPASAHNAA